ncbi:MAG: hypothetical protein A2142_01940 [candidate division Zixibacteria bacterium RBG_16_48_11]|nr:MAG: hypothetical protein A2142_01940 [candidate division Zixibacteria bacterium RBG_16_48_11]
MRKTWVLILALALLALPAMAANKVLVKSTVDADVAFDLETDQDLAGLAVALKFADKDDDVTLKAASFVGTRLEGLKLKEAIIDNVEKTVVVFGIVLEEKPIAAGTGTLVILTFEGKDVSKVKFTPTTVGKQEGITLVTPAAKEIGYEFTDQSRIEGKGTLPQTYGLFQNFPNPFNATTQIRYALPEPAEVRLEVFNILGQKVKTLVNEFQTAGNKQVVWEGRNENGDVVSSGVYFYRINAGKYNQVMKMSLLK